MQARFCKFVLLQGVTDQPEVAAIVWKAAN